jgi:hypothetical protein
VSPTPVRLVLEAIARFRRCTDARDDRAEKTWYPVKTAGSTRFHVEHVRARQHDGSDDPSNLALACPHCNRDKGPNLTGIDPETDWIVPLFNPRQDAHSDHSTLDGIFFVGVTPTGRATVRVLAMNSDEQLRRRRSTLE